ncbi:hypothetical protein DFH08DRAFT_905414, partial [Mycena albidolilacea]
MILLIFAVVASGFAFSAREASKLTDLVLWCHLHNGSEAEKKDATPFLAVDFPVMLVLAPGLSVSGILGIAGRGS